MKGIIGLDIDGTIVGDDHILSDRVRDYLTALSDDGWQIVFATGRTFTYGYQTIKAFSFPYAYACYNGALTLAMPERKMLHAHPLAKSRIPDIEAACQAAGTGCFIHMGILQGDACYFRSAEFPPAATRYISDRAKKTGEQWISIDHFENLPFDAFIYAKAFGTREQMERIEQALEAEEFHLTVIRDPLRTGGAGILITHTLATKGAALHEMRTAAPEGVPVIAAGDDINDLTLLQEADIGIAMQPAPEEVRAAADIIAPPIEDEGIIVGLEQALHECH